MDGGPNLAENTGYPLDVLQANLANLPARSVQLFLDACFSGNSSGGMLQSATSGIAISVQHQGGGIGKEALGGKTGSATVLEGVGLHGRVDRQAPVSR